MMLFGRNSGNIIFRIHFPQDYGVVKESNVVSVFSGNAAVNAENGFWPKDDDGLVKIPYVFKSGQFTLCTALSCHTGG